MEKSISKKNIILTAIAVMFAMVMTGISVNADAGDPGTMGSAISQEPQEQQAEKEQVELQAQEQAKMSPMKRALMKLNITSSHPVYDLSEWQGNISDRQAAALKNEVPFVILRVQYGSGYKDKTFAHNAAMMQKYGIPYGAYSYSMYTSTASAQTEARNLVSRAPGAAFYVNDFEDVKVSKNNATNRAWKNQVSSMAPGRKVFLYSGSYFMSKNTTATTRNAYNGIWEANYGGTPQFGPILWQYTDKHSSAALGKKVDASKSSLDPSWFGQNIANFSIPYVSPYYKSKSVKKVRVIAKHGIWTYSKHNRRLHKIRKGKILKVSGYTKKFSKANKFKHKGASTHFTANKKYVKWVK